MCPRTVEIEDTCPGHVGDAEKVITLVEACNCANAHKKVHVPCSHALTLCDADGATDLMEGFSDVT